MLHHVKYLGHELTASTFRLLQEPDNDGQYSYAIEAHDSVVIDEVTEDEEGADSPVRHLTIPMTATVKGLEAETKTEVFDIALNFQLRFELARDFSMDEDALSESSWFFMNFAHVAAKEMIDGMLSHTVLRGTFMPAHRRSAD
ncbi:hypothetical protein OOT00_15415 [Desulfobotulus sp. H1]|uniref:Uncharacterized protein n=1 Tax=Desulfobotulus pelophilus TaxID=2823377 RepID=A0ABT3NEQ1_9BACT|nr:hypothetical protein [Desulfobotulus pelophilus]MCW7755372.1 hypothetical protein [Desulfobotulus pelophilus]